MNYISIVNQIIKTHKSINLTTSNFAESCDSLRYGY